MQPTIRALLRGCWAFGAAALLTTTAACSCSPRSDHDKFCSAWAATTPTDRYSDRLAATFGALEGKVSARFFDQLNAMITWSPADHVAFLANYFHEQGLAFHCQPFIDANRDDRR